MENGMKIPPEIGNNSLWQDRGFQECLKHAVEYQLSPYYFQRMDDILRPSYIPLNKMYYNLVFILQE